MLAISEIFGLPPKTRKTFIEPIAAHCTERTCSDCLNDYENIAVVRSQKASFWRFTADERGAKDKTSRIPVCTRHAQEAA